MGIMGTLMMYLVIGVVIALASRIGSQQTLSLRVVTEVGTWIVLWPFFAPALLGQAVSGVPSPGSRSPWRPPSPEAEGAPQRLIQAIQSLDTCTGWDSKPSLAPMQAIMQSLSNAQHRLRDIETLLETREFGGTQVATALADLQTRGYGDHDPRICSLLARQRNIARLQTMRERTREELERALLKIEEISSQVLLLRFADHPEAKLASLLTEVASHVEGLTSVMLDEA